MVGGAAAGADEPLSLSAQCDQLRGKSVKRIYRHPASAVPTTRLDDDDSPAAIGTLPETNMSIPNSAC